MNLKKGQALEKSGIHQQREVCDFFTRRSSYKTLIENYKVKNRK